MPLTQEQQEAVRMGTPIEWNGLTLFPILMKDYNRFRRLFPGADGSFYCRPLFCACKAL